MIRSKILTALALGALLSVGSTANAAFLTGTIGFNSDLTRVVLPPGLDVTNGTDFSFSTNAGGAGTQTTTSNPTGSFSNVTVNTVVNSTDLVTSPTPSFTLSLNGNSFTATSILADTVGLRSRTIDFLGTITGSNFTTTPALFIAQFNQAGGPGTTISYAGTLAAAVPEPSSIALVGIGSLGLMGLGWRRARRKGE